MRDPERERLGQAFCNRFGITDANLFYASERDARAIINDYINWGEVE
jgi:hypothetical protein